MTKNRFNHPLRKPLTGITDMHSGNLSFLDDGNRPYTLAPAHDMLPLAEDFVQRLRTDTRLSPDFAPGIRALEVQLGQATQHIALLG